MLFFFFFIDDFFESEEKEEFDTEISDDLLFFSLILRTRIKDGYHVPKIDKFVEEIVPRMNEIEFKKHFRLSRDTYNILLTELGPSLKYRQRSTGKPALTPDKQLLVFLWYMANQDSMREDACLFGVSPFSVHRCVRRTSKTLCDKLLRKFIVWPDHDAQEQISNVIYESSGLPNCIGFIDGTHIGLSFLPNGDKDYINRKGYPSIQLQLVVDDKMMIRDTYVGWPGCVHDARVYRNSPIFNCLEHDSGVHLAPGKYLIGDAAYPLSPFMMTPFKAVGNLSNAQKLYNRKVSSVRQTVERTIGHLKGRFRRLRELYCMNIEDCCYLITSACILHNLCVLKKDDIEDYLEPNPNHLNRVNYYPNVYRNDPRGVNKRNALVLCIHNCYMQH
ncbi:putative nuclease HARBI1 [Magallana gigas]|uniref:putative nuclease HARBI1 n=1 Tax=Magallana gigas TaxID=29159 RepID=UPI0033400C25